jgi:hypothetical protein
LNAQLLSTCDSLYDCYPDVQPFLPYGYLIFKRSQSKEGGDSLLRGEDFIDDLTIVLTREGEDIPEDYHPIATLDSTSQKSKYSGSLIQIHIHRKSC